MLPLPNVTPWSVRSFENYSSSTSLHPTAQVVSSTDVLPCHDRYPLLVCCCPILFNPFILYFFLEFFKKSFGKSNIFSLIEWPSIIRGSAYTFEMFETCRFRRKRFWLQV
ncbi:hypothetical protein CDAR_426581 [Caerostris darwini]|uniref:Uncharacterized protein n=1 Tax=Caerostris darwini TaxID=1538125 RepID=A0AAV4NA06_9ARAC|nr:hypothetical protein CDAR_426581 [Caerostris darwini]